MSNLQGAFDTLIALVGREMVIERMGQYSPLTVKVAMSNYFRDFDAPANVVIEGRELVMSVRSIKDTDYHPPKRGDRIDDSEIGEQMVKDVREMFGIKGEILGYRIRVG